MPFNYHVYHCSLSQHPSPDEGLVCSQGHNKMWSSKEKIGKTPQSVLSCSTLGTWGSFLSESCISVLHSLFITKHPLQGNADILICFYQHCLSSLFQVSLIENPRYFVKI